MACVHTALKKSRTPVRLEKGTKPPPLLVDLILVRIEPIGLGTLVDRGRKGVQGMLSDFVVVIEQGDVVAAGNREGGIARAGDPNVLVEKDRLDAGIVRVPSDDVSNDGRG